MSMGRGEIQRRPHPGGTSWLGQGDLGRVRCLPDMPHKGLQLLAQNSLSITLLDFL